MCNNQNIYAMNVFQKLRCYLRLREAVRQADKAHAKTGERYYVLPSSTGTNLIIMDRYNFRLLKHKGYITTKAHVRDLAAECFYCTPYRNGSGAMPPQVIRDKSDSYYSWCTAQSKLDKTRKHAKD